MYQTFFHKLNEIEDIDYLPEGYEEFKEYVLLTEYGQKRHLYEFAMPSKLKAKIDFIKQLADEMGKDAKTLFQLFLNPKVFEFFNRIKWSMGHLFDLMKDGYKAYREIRQAIKEYLAKNKVVHWTTEKLKDLDEFLNQHPNLKRIGGLVIAGLLIYLWTQISFTGDLDADFDLSLIFSALQGHLGFADVFSGPNGIELLLLLVTNLMGLSFPFPGAQSVQFVFAVVYTLGKKYLPKFFKHGRMTEGAIDELREFTIKDISAQQMPIIRRTSAERKKLKGKEATIARFIGIKGKASAPILQFATEPTYHFHMPAVEDHSKPKEENIYVQEIQLLDLNKWRKGKYLYQMDAKEFREILSVCEVKIHCSCMFFTYGGLRYFWDQLDSAIYSEPIESVVWPTRQGYDSPSVCKHLKGILPLISFHAPAILKQIKAKYSGKKKY